ncbi:MAG TPA: HD domain-containing protein [Clostridium sp.]
MINKAIIFATKAHTGQFRKGTNTPYILHTLEAGIIVSQIKSDEDLICSAILHDVIEDTDITFAMVKKKFNERIAHIVASESEDKSKSWKERKGYTLESLTKEKSEDIGIVALGDKLSNMRAIDRDLQVIGDKLWERFNVKDKNEHKWYYSGLVDSLSYLSEYNAYQEFKRLVDKVFDK